MKFVFLLLTTVLAAFAAAPTPTTLKAAVVIGAKDEVKLGTLTVGDKQLDFEGADLLFSVPLDAVEDVQVAGVEHLVVEAGENVGLIRMRAERMCEVVVARKHLHYGIEG